MSKEINDASEVIISSSVVFLLVLLAATMLVGCSTQPQVPQMTSQGSPAIIINPSCTENCYSQAAIETGSVEAESSSEADSSTKTDKSLLWAIISFVLVAAASVFAWFKWIRK